MLCLLFFIRGKDGARVVFFFVVIPLTHHKNSGYTEYKVLGVYLSHAAGGEKITSTQFFLIDKGIVIFFFMVIPLTHHIFASKQGRCGKSACHIAPPLRKGRVLGGRPLPRTLNYGYKILAC